MMQEKKKFLSITCEEICKLYNLLREDGEVSFPPSNESLPKLEALVENITSASFGIEHYKTNEEKAVAYLYFIIKNHPFTDGNKRTASIVFLVLCDINDLHPDFFDFSLDELVVFIEKTKINDHQKFIGIVAKALFEKTFGL